MIQDLGRSMVVVVNKWDRWKSSQRKKIKSELEIKLPFLPNPEALFISALHGSNLAEVMPAALRAYNSAMISMATSSINRALAAAGAQTPPTHGNRRRGGLKCAPQSGANPPVLGVHGNVPGHLPDSDRRCLANYFARAYHLAGSPVRITPRPAPNPFAGRKSAPKRQKKPAKKPPGRRRKA